MVQFISELKQTSGQRKQANGCKQVGERKEANKSKLADQIKEVNKLKMK